MNKIIETMSSKKFEITIGVSILALILAANSLIDWIDAFTAIMFVACIYLVAQGAVDIIKYKK